MKSRDDSDDKGKKAEYDENGNPCLSEHVSQHLPNSYMQMREPPQPVDRGATASKTRFRQNQNGCFPSKLEQLENYSFSGQQVKDLEDLSTAQSSADNAHKKPRKKVKKEKVIRAEEVENYVGDKDVSELVKFIEQDNGGPAAKKAGKKLNHTTAAPLPTTIDTITTSVKTSEKNAKKSRDKKHRPSVGIKVIEGHSGRERSESVSALSGKEEEEEAEDLPSVPLKQEEDDVELEAVIVENPVAVQSKDSLLLIQNTSVSVNTMGNSYGRTSKEENGLITSDESVIGACEKLNNDISGENNKDFSKLVTQNHHVVHSIGKVRINSLHENDKIHEDKSVKNNKKKMGSVTVTTPASVQVNNNKKTDKAKNAAGEEKLVTGATNNVKHNNNKNSKVKREVSPVETLEGEGQTKSDNVKVVPSIAPAACAATANVKNNVVIPKEYYDSYIFTDLDLPAAEPEFTVVGKKKKRPVTGPVHTTPQMIKEPNNSNHSIKNCNVHATPRTVGRVERPRKPVPRSVTPPPRNSLSTTDSIDSERLRDLSPSSFPALSSSGSSINCGRQTFREGRRNSTGDVPCKEIVLKVQDDSSDIESVKSLPVAQGGPPLPVSYAKMAASPKPSNTSLAGSSGETDEMYDSSQEANREWKCANWKGSPTERRHSIGSSPENNLKEIDNMLPTRQRYGGSQELLVAPGEAEEGAVAPGDEAAVSPVASPSACFMSEDPFVVVVPSASEPVCSKVMFGDVTMASVSPSCKGTNSLSDHQSPVSSSTTVHKTVLPGDVITPPSVECAAHLAVEGVNDVPGECVPPLKEPSPECGGQQTTKSLVPPTKHHTGNGRKVHKNKSVIFLDKRLNQVPKNLGITFGFELAIDTDSIGSSPELCSVAVDDTSISSTSSPSATSVLSHQSSHSDSDVPSVDTNSVITSSHQHSHSETSSEMCTSSSFTFDNEKCKQSVVTNLSKDDISKISHSLSGKNGVVLPNTDHCEIVPPASVETSNMAVHSCQTSKSTIENKISSDPDIPKGNNSRPNSIVVCYGDSNNKLMDLASSIPSASDKTDCARQLRFVPEKDVDKTCFHMAEAVAYVVREWDRFVQLKDKHPANVVVYSSSE